MTDSSIDLVQYALVGGGIFVLIAVGIIPILLKGWAKRDAKKEAKRKKKQARKEAKVSQSVNLVQEELQPVKVGNLVQEEQQQVKAENPVQEELQPVKAANPVEEEEIQPVKAANPVQEEIQPVKAVNPVQEEIQPVEVVNPVEEELPPVEIESKLEEEVQLAKVESKPLEAPILLHFYKVHSTEKGENKQFLLENSLTIGRNIGVYQWTITGDPTISGHHCKIYQRNNEVYILDLNSTNGTYVNGKRVRGEMKLTDLDKIRIGQSEYRIGM